MNIKKLLGLDSLTIKGKNAHKVLVLNSLNGDKLYRGRLRKIQLDEEEGIQVVIDTKDDELVINLQTVKSINKMQDGSYLFWIYYNE